MEPLNLEDAAAYFGVSHYTLRSWIREGRIPYHRIGAKLIRIVPQEVLDASRIDATAGGPVAVCPNCTPEENTDEDN